MNIDDNGNDGKKPCHVMQCNAMSSQAKPKTKVKSELRKSTTSERDRGQKMHSRNRRIVEMILCEDKK